MLEEENQDVQGNYTKEPLSYNYNYKEEVLYQYFTATTAEPKRYIYRDCSEEFTSKNRLYSYLGNTSLGRNTPNRIYLGRSLANTWNKELKNVSF